MIYDFQRILSRRLFTWGAISLGAGLYLIFQQDAIWKGLGLQGMVWGAIEVILAFLSLRFATARLGLPFDSNRQAHAARTFRRTLWISAGLALLILAAGGFLVLTEEGGTEPFWRGMGWGITLQGGFLLLFSLFHALTTPGCDPLLPDLNLLSTPEHEAFELPGDRGLVILVHGFPGTPNEMRSLAQELNRAGWAVRVPLLPGFGVQISSLFRQRTAGWVRFLSREVSSARATGKPVVLCGFSMGGALAISAALASQPDRLVLIAPFWFNETLPLRAAVWLVRLVLPVSLRPFRLVPFPTLHLQSAAGQVAPEVNLAHPEVQQAIRPLQVPLLFLEQFRQMGKNVRQQARSLQMPTLILQGERDPITRPELSRKLASMIGPNARYSQVNGEHHVVLPTSPAFGQVVQEILHFLDDIPESKNPEGH